MGDGRALVQAAGVRVEIAVFLQERRAGLAQLVEDGRTAASPGARDALLAPARTRITLYGIGPSNINRVFVCGSMCVDIDSLLLLDDQTMQFCDLILEPVLPGLVGSLFADQGRLEFGNVLFRILGALPSVLDLPGLLAQFLLRGMLLEVVDPRLESVAFLFAFLERRSQIIALLQYLRDG